MDQKNIIKRKYLKYVKMKHYISKSRDTLRTKVVLRGQFISLNVYTRKERVKY